MLKVTKFGGSSLASAEQFKKVAEIINADKDRHFVIASAPGKRNATDSKVTDMLYNCCELAQHGKDYTPLLFEIKQRFADIICGLGIAFDLDSEFAKIKAALQNPKSDYMASRGEHLNSKILAKYLGWKFIETADYLVFDENGVFMPEVSNARLEKALADVDYAVVPGFYGAKENGEIKTFSRGGSDITGSIVARASHADIYENWTDVSGVYAADPRIVKNPRTISHITYKELRELSYMGASVLHEDAVFPVRKAGIPINIRNTNRPKDCGTLIVPELPRDVKKHIVTGIAGRKGFSTVLVEKAMLNTVVGFGATLLGIFAENAVSFEHVPTGIDTMSVTVNTKEFNNARDTVLRQITQKLQPDELMVEDGFALIAVVGHRMVSQKGVAARIFKAVSEAGVNIRMIDQGSSELNIIIGVNEADYETTIRAIYDEMKDLF